MPTPADVLVIGDALLDVVVAPAGPMRPGGDVPAAVGIGPGGQGANVAVRLARRGIPVRLACAIGDDPAGRLVRAALEADGVAVEGAAANATGAVAILVDPNGERTMLSQRVPLRGIEPGAVERAGWVVLSGYALPELELRPPRGDDRPRRMLLGCSLLDASHAARWLAAAQRYRPQLLVLNVDEAATLCESTEPPAELARHLAGRLDAAAVVTHPGGCAAAVGSAAVEVRGSPDATPVDLTGAGDAVAAGLLVDLLATDHLWWPPSPEALEHAMAAGVTLAAEVARVAGGQGRVPSEGAA